MRDERGMPIDALAWQEVLHRMQLLEEKIFYLQEEITVLRKEAFKQPKILTWRDVP